MEAFPNQRGRFPKPFPHRTNASRFKERFAVSWWATHLCYIVIERYDTHHYILFAVDCPLARTCYDFGPPDLTYGRYGQLPSAGWTTTTSHVRSNAEAGGFNLLFQKILYAQVNHRWPHITYKRGRVRKKSSNGVALALNGLAYTSIY